MYISLDLWMHRNLIKLLVYANKTKIHEDVTKIQFLLMYNNGTKIPEYDSTGYNFVQLINPWNNEARKSWDQKKKRYMATRTRQRRNNLSPGTQVFIRFVLRAV